MDSAKKAQFKLLDLFSLMVNAPNSPEGFRAGYQLRGFKTGNARFPLSPDERILMDDIRGRIACVLTECGFTEAASQCKCPPTQQTVAKPKGRTPADVFLHLRSAISFFEAKPTQAQPKQAIRLKFIKVP
jgi:hypothetical protein